MLGLLTIFVASILTHNIALTYLLGMCPFISLSQRLKTACGMGVAVIDPHGDLVEALLCLIKEGHIEKTIYFDPGDPEYVPLWNPLKISPGQDISRTADDLVAAIKSVVNVRPDMGFEELPIIPTKYPAIAANRNPVKAITMAATIELPKFAVKA